MAQIKLLRGSGVTPTKPDIVDGQLLFDIGNHSLWLDTSSSTRIKLYDSLDTVITDVTNIQQTLEGVDGSVGDAIEKAIEDLKEELKKEFVTDVVAADNSVVVSSDDEEVKLKVRISSKDNNTLKLVDDSGEEGLYVPKTEVPEYTITKVSAEESYAATYQLEKDGQLAGVKINIPKSFIVKSADMKNAAGTDDPYDGAVEGEKYVDLEIELTEGGTKHIYIPVKDLVGQAYTGKTADDGIITVTVGEDYTISATIADESITKDKLESDIQASLKKADSAVQPDQLKVEKEDKKYIAGISVDGDMITIHKESFPDSLDVTFEWGTFQVED